MVYFTKIRYKESEGKVELHYQVFNEKTETYDLKTLKSEETPHPDFSKAFKALAPDVMELCEISENEGEKFEDTVQVTSVSLSWKEMDYGAVITATRELEHSHTPLNLNTPLKWSDASDEAGEEVVLPAEISSKIERLTTEAERFLEGERAQMRMKFDDEKEPQEG